MTKKKSTVRAGLVPAPSRRFPDWDLRLIEFASAVNKMPFEWGNTNCAALAAGCIDAMLGTDLFQFQRDLDLDEAKARTLSAEGRTRQTFISAGLQILENHKMIQRGDIILAFDDGWECCHIVLGKYAIASTPDRGVFFFPVSRLFQGSNSKSQVSPLEVFRCPQ